MHLFLKKIYRKNPFPKIYRINQCEVLNTVVHQVEMSLFPNWIGTDLIRVFKFQEGGNQLLLSTIPFVTRKGVMVKQVLLWERL